MKCKSKNDVKDELESTKVDRGPKVKKIKEHSTTSTYSERSTLFCSEPVKPCSSSPIRVELADGHTNSAKATTETHFKPLLPNKLYTNSDIPILVQFSPSVPGLKENEDPSYDPYEEFDNCQRHPNCKHTLEEVKRMADSLPSCMGVRLRVNYIRQIYKHGRDPDTWDWKKYENVLPDYTSLLSQPINITKNVPHPNCKTTKRRLTKLSQSLPYSKSRKCFVYLCFYHGLDPEETLKRITENPLVPWVACPEPWRALEVSPTPPEIPRVKEGYYTPKCALGSKVRVTQPEPVKGSAAGSYRVQSDRSFNSTMSEHTIFFQPAPDTNPAAFQSQSGPPSKALSTENTSFPMPNHKERDMGKACESPKHDPIESHTVSSVQHPAHNNDCNNQLGGWYSQPPKDSFPQSEFPPNPVASNSDFYSSWNRYQAAFSSWNFSVSWNAGSAYNPQFNSHWLANSQTWNSSLFKYFGGANDLTPFPPPPPPPPPPPFLPCTTSDSEAKDLLEPWEVSDDMEPSTTNPLRKTDVTLSPFSSEVRNQPPLPPELPLTIKTEFQPPLPTQSPPFPPERNPHKENFLGAGNPPLPPSPPPAVPPLPFLNNPPLPPSPPPPSATPLSESVIINSLKFGSPESNHHPSCKTKSTNSNNPNNVHSGTQNSTKKIGITLEQQCLPCPNPKSPNGSDMANKDPASLYKNSTIKERSQTCRSESQPHRIPVLIEPTEYPRVRLSDKQMTLIENCILDGILEIDAKGVKPVFNQSFRRNGRYGVICSDDFSRKWLCAYLGTHKPWPTSSLRIVPDGYTNVLAKAILPLSRDDSDEKILRFIEKQNEGLFVGKWEVIKRWESNDLKTCIDLVIDDKSAEVLEKSSSIVFKMGTGNIILAQNKEFDSLVRVESLKPADVDSLKCNNNVELWEKEKSSGLEISDFDSLERDIYADIYDETLLKNSSEELSLELVRKNPYQQIDRPSQSSGQADPILESKQDKRVSKEGSRACSSSSSKVPKLSASVSYTPRIRCHSQSSPGRLSTISRFHGHISTYLPTSSQSLPVQNLQSNIADAGSATDSGSSVSGFQGASQEFINPPISVHHQPDLTDGERIKETNSCESGLEGSSHECSNSSVLVHHQPDLSSQGGVPDCQKVQAGASDFDFRYLNLLAIFSNNLQSSFQHRHDQPLDAITDDLESEYTRAQESISLPIQHRSGERIQVNPASDLQVENSSTHDTDFQDSDEELPFFECRPGQSLQDAATEQFRKLIAAGYSSGKALQLTQAFVSRKLK